MRDSTHHLLQSLRGGAPNARHAQAMTTTFFMTIKKFGKRLLSHPLHRIPILPLAPQPRRATRHVNLLTFIRPETERYKNIPIPPIVNIINIRSTDLSVFACQHFSVFVYFQPQDCPSPEHRTARNRV